MLCRYFYTTKGCKAGENCRYLHIPLAENNIIKAKVTSAHATNAANETKNQGRPMRAHAMKSARASKVKAARGDASAGASTHATMDGDNNSISNKIGNVGVSNVAPRAPTQKMKLCKYGVKCRNVKVGKCNFYHPRYENGCVKVDDCVESGNENESSDTEDINIGGAFCPKDHEIEESLNPETAGIIELDPTSRSNSSSSQRDKQTQPLSYSSTSIQRKKPKKCRFKDECRNPKCEFMHPGDESEENAKANVDSTARTKINGYDGKKTKRLNKKISSGSHQRSRKPLTEKEPGQSQNTKVAIDINKNSKSKTAASNQRASRRKPQDSKQKQFHISSLPLDNTATTKFPAPSANANDGSRSDNEQSEIILDELWNHLDNSRETKSESTMDNPLHMGFSGDRNNAHIMDGELSSSDLQSKSSSCQQSNPSSGLQGHEDPNVARMRLLREQQIAICLKKQKRTTQTHEDSNAEKMGVNYLRQEKEHIAKKQQQQAHAQAQWQAVQMQGGNRERKKQCQLDAESDRHSQNIAEFDLIKKEVLKEENEQIDLIHQAQIQSLHLQQQREIERQIMESELAMYETELRQREVQEKKKQKEVERQKREEELRQREVQIQMEKEEKEQQRMKEKRRFELQRRQRREEDAKAKVEEEAEKLRLQKEREEFLAKRKAEKKARKLKMQEEKRLAEMEMKREEEEKERFAQEKIQEQATQYAEEQVKKAKEMEAKKNARAKLLAEQKEAARLKKEKDMEKRANKAKELLDERRKFWETDQRHREEYLFVVKKICEAEIMRKCELKYTKQVEDEVIKSYNDLFPEIAQSKVVVADPQNKSYSGRVGTILGWNMEKGKYKIGFETKKHRIEEVFIKPEHLEIPTKSVDKSKSKHKDYSATFFGSLSLRKSTVDIMISMYRVGDGALEKMIAKTMSDRNEADKEESERQIRYEKEKEAYNRAREADRERRRKAREAEQAAWKAEEESRARCRERYEKARQEARKKERSYRRNDPFGGSDPFFGSGIRIGIGPDGRPFVFGSFRGGGGGYGASGFFDYFDSDDDYDNDDYYYEDDDFEEGGTTLEEHAEALGVSVEATPSEIRSAFKKKALKLHPDKYKEENHNGMTKEEVEEEFKRCNAAHEFLMMQHED